MVLGLILATRFYKNNSFSFGPVGLGYLAASIRKELPDVKIVMPEILDQMIVQKPDLIGISSRSENYSVVIDYAKTIKKTLNVPVVIGGFHVSTLPESLNEIFDVAILGEGEVTFAELLTSIIENKNINDNELESIQGLAFKIEGILHITPPREIVKDLDSLPKRIVQEQSFYRKSRLGCIVSSPKIS